MAAVPHPSFAKWSSSAPAGAVRLSTLAPGQMATLHGADLTAHDCALLECARADRSLCLANLQGRRALHRASARHSDWSGAIGRRQHPGRSSRRGVMPTAGVERESVLRPAPVAVPRSTRTLRVALIGNPNTGKTTLFNRLCGTRAKTSNFPGTTTSAQSRPRGCRRRRRRGRRRSAGSLPAQPRSS